ncbi:Trm112 family protein [Arthrobacter roseus]|uniref:Trm112 family protein n=1 Tax=Arthrobacter roseus TaxID=136274 RepID=UPI00196321A7|nr:hypothetical protein [Arthrobacter roseus]MBM7848005.1 uncharacterized protein YbaR (Trm112 family) [Arthrobacter roseus]
MLRISAGLLSVLRCPVTGSALTQDGGELLSTVPGPMGAPMRYRIDNGIPVLLPTSR